MLQRGIYPWFVRQFEDQKSKGSIEVLDGVRALAFLIVLALHLTNMATALHIWNRGTKPFLSALFEAGFSGVTLFFVLSGFLLFLPYARALLCQKSWPDIKVFYLRRVLRIFPLYYLSLAIFIIFGHTDYLHPSMWGKLWPFLTFTMGFWQSQAIDGPYWTLAVEFQFYVILPLIALAIAGCIYRLPDRLRLWGVSACLLLTMAWSLTVYSWETYHTALMHTSFLLAHPFVGNSLNILLTSNSKYLGDFAVGMLVATIYTFVHNSSRKDLYWQRCRRLGYGLVILWIALFILGAMRSYHAIFGYDWQVASQLFRAAPWSTELCFALSFGCCVFAALFARTDGPLHLFFTWSPLRWLGLLTYSLYIWHVPLLLAIQKSLAPIIVSLLPHWLAYLACGTAVFGVAASISFITYLLVEKPGMRLSERLRQKLLTQARPRKSAA